jgi:phospholipase/carboxylesterase
MKHIYKKGNQQTLILLHGTGGDEFDLIPLAETLNPKASILSIRGNVLENGMPRYFKRLSIGVFDMESLKQETIYLQQFIQEASSKYGFSLTDSTVIGYSNGANIAISMLFTFNHTVKRAILLRPMVPTHEIQSSSLNQTQVVIISGKYDSIVPKNHPQILNQYFNQLGADTQVFEIEASHGLTPMDMEIMKSILKNEQN